jgi:hypothetical protein
LGGEVVYENGQAFIYAGGDKIATSYKLEYPSPALTTMWHHKDPNMSSYRSTEPGGTVLGTGLDNHDWDKIETDGDGKSVGLSAPVYFPEHSNELYTSGWSFGSLSNGQYAIYSVDGIHVPEEYVRATRLDNRHGSLNLDLLFFSAVRSRLVTIYDPSGKTPLGTFDFGEVPENLIPTSQNELRFDWAVPGWWSINLLPIPQQQIYRPGDLRDEVISFFKKYGKAFRRCTWKIFATDNHGDPSDVAKVMVKPSSRVFPYDTTVYFAADTNTPGGHHRQGQIGLPNVTRSTYLHDGTFVSAVENFHRAIAHEYANYLSWSYTGNSRTFGVKEGIRGDATPGGGVRSANFDTDTGAAMEKCIWGNTSY